MQNEVVLFGNQAKRFENWPNSLEAGYKQPKWYYNLAEQTVWTQTTWKLAKRFTEA